MDSKNEVKKDKKNVLKRIYYVLTYGISLSLIVFSIIIYDYMKFRVFYSVILFCIFLTPDIYKLIKNKKIRVILKILLPILSVLLFLYNLYYRQVEINKEQIKFDDKFQERSKDISNWVGKYEYTSLDNNEIETTFNLEIKKVDKDYVANLEVIKNNKSTLYNLTIDTKSTKDNILFNYDSQDRDSDNTFNKGDYLFRITKDNYNILTYWVKNIGGIFNDGECFKKVDSFNYSKRYKTYYFKKGDIIYFYKINYKNSDYSYVTYSTDNYSNVKTEYNNFNTLGSYTCINDNCNVFTVNSDTLYTIIYDDEYYLYNIVDDKKEKVIEIDDTYYNSIEIVSKDKEILGIILSKESKDYEESYLYDYAYYNLLDNKYNIEFGKYNDIYFDVNSIKNNNLYCSINNSYDDNYKSYLVSIDNKIVKENINGSIGKGNNVYYYLGEEGEDVYIKTLYDNKYNIIYNVTGDKSLSSYDYKIDNNELVLAHDNKFYIYKNYELVYESKNEYKEIYNVFDSFIAVNKDGYLTLINYNEEEKSRMCEIKDGMYVHYMISGDYEDKGKKGIFMVVSDESVKYEDIDKETLDSFGVNESNYSDYRDMLGYEYYYVPETGETGKFPTLIGGYAKPVLYLYPTNDNTLVNVKFDKPKLLTTTYPKYSDGWSVIANKDGNLKDKNGRNYYGLYWEEEGSTKVDFKTGFYVESKDAIKFLEDKLEEIGLNERESNEFIMYWLPILEKNKKNLVYFELTDERQAYNKLNIYPEVNSLLRVSIHVKKVDKKVKIKKQTFKKFVRNGFTAVEWGGVIH